MSCTVLEQVYHDRIARLPDKTNVPLRLTAGQKRVLCDHKANNPDVSQRKMCKWAKEQLNLDYEPSPATLLMIFKKPVAANAASAWPERKTNQLVQAPALEKALVQWIDLVSA